MRTFIDQRFSRQIHARAGIIINTGEDNYLTTADAVDAAHTVIVSQLLNEFFAKEAGLADDQLGLGHAFEIKPDVPDSFLLELAHALLVRELFPDAPLKYMPPTKHMTGNIFAGYLLDAFFNLAAMMTEQEILLDRHDDRGHPHPVLVRPGSGAGERRAMSEMRLDALARASGPSLAGSSPSEPIRCSMSRSTLLRKIGADGLLNAIADGTFGMTKRPADGGRGLDGVIVKSDGYFNPASEILDGEQAPPAGELVASQNGAGL